MSNLRFHWLEHVYFVLIGCCDYYQFVLVLRYSIEKRSRQLVIFFIINFAY